MKVKRIRPFKLRNGFAGAIWWMPNLVLKFAVQRPGGSHPALQLVNNEQGRLLNQVLLLPGTSLKKKNVTDISDVSPSDRWRAVVVFPGERECPKGHPLHELPKITLFLLTHHLKLPWEEYQKTTLRHGPCELDREKTLEARRRLVKHLKGEYAAELLPAQIPQGWLRRLREYGRRVLGLSANETEKRIQIIRKKYSLIMLRQTGNLNTLEYLETLLEKVHA
jgi:hypothetical protein